MLGKYDGDVPVVLVVQVSGKGIKKFPFYSSESIFITENYGISTIFPQTYFFDMKKLCRKHEEIMSILI